MWRSIQVVFTFYLYFPYGIPVCYPQTKSFIYCSAPWSTGTETSVGWRRWSNTCTTVQSALTGPQISWGDRRHPYKDIFPNQAHNMFAVRCGCAPTVKLVLLLGLIESLLNLWILAFSILLVAPKSYSEGLLVSGSWSNTHWITLWHTDTQIISNIFEKHQ